MYRPLEQNMDIFRFLSLCLSICAISFCLPQNIHLLVVYFQHNVAFANISLTQEKP